MSIMIQETANIKRNNFFDERCMICFQKTYHRLFEKFNVETLQRQRFNEFFNETLTQNAGEISPILQRELNKKFCEIIGIPDPFSEEKSVSNNIALELYKEWKIKVLASENPFDLALRLAIAGNIMDYGANGSFSILQTIEKVISSKFAIDNSVVLKQKLEKASKILYLGDNAGEIVFDKLFIETIMHSNITYAVKGSPILNDATINDAMDIGMDLVADVISNGYDAPSTILDKCSKEFLEIYNAADIIISKGQGNLEGLISLNDPRIFFLLMVKCEVVAEVLGVQKGSFVVYNSLS